MGPGTWHFDTAHIIEVHHSHKFICQSQRVWLWQAQRVGGKCRAYSHVFQEALQESWLVVLQDRAGRETARADRAEADATSRSQEIQQAQQDLAGAQVMLIPDCYAKTQIHILVTVCAPMKNRSLLGAVGSPEWGLRL